MVVACIALTVALSGASYAAINLPKNSVGTKHLKRNAVTSAKVRDNSLRAADINQATLGFGRAVSVAGVDFRARNSTTTIVYHGGGAISRSAGSDWMTATVELPEKARITKVTFHVVDNDVANFGLALTRYEPATKSTVDLVVTNSGSLAASTSVQAVEGTPATPSVVENAKYVYRVLINPGVNTAAHQIAGATVHYRFGGGTVAREVRPRPSGGTDSR